MPEDVHAPVREAEGRRPSAELAKAFQIADKIERRDAHRRRAARSLAENFVGEGDGKVAAKHFLQPDA